MHRVPQARRRLRVVDGDQVCDASGVLADEAGLLRCSALLDALGDSNRLRILLVLHHAGDLCVSDLAVAVGMSDSAVSHALRLLRAHGLVKADRHGRHIRYHLGDALAVRLLEVVSSEVVHPEPRHHDHQSADEPEPRAVAAESSTDVH